MELTLSTLTLSLALTGCAYISYLCYTPPYGSPSKPYAHDRLNIIANLHSTRLQHLVVIFVVMLFGWHILLLLFPDERSSICRNPDLLNGDLFSWSRRTVVFLLITAVSGGVRLAAFGGLGQNFTFTLAVPKGLVTTGIYGYIQHPSYTGMIGLQIADSLFAFRLDGVAACVLPARIVEVPHLSDIVGIVTLLGMIGMLSLRIRDEEEMMKGEFGREWEVWHGRTKRLVPGVI